jgi:hypothetical protein
MLRINPLTRKLNPSAQRYQPRFLLGILIIKEFTAQRLYRSFGVQGSTPFNTGIKSLRAKLPAEIFLFLIFKGLTARRLFKSFGVKGLNPSTFPGQPMTGHNKVPSQMNIICGKKQVKNGWRQNYKYRNILMKTRNLRGLNLCSDGCGCAEVQCRLHHV